MLVKLMWEGKYVTKALKIRLDVTPREERIINQNIGNAGFTWNRLLERVKYQKVKPTITNLNKIINELKREYPFLKKSESSSLQQVGRDITNAHEKHEKEGRGFPRFKSRKNPKNSYRIQCNNNNIRLNEKGTRIRIPKIGFVKFSTSKEYVQELKESKINHMTRI